MTEMSADPVQHRYSSQGLDLAYVGCGDCADPLVILVHGSRDHSRSWDWIAAVLVATGRRVGTPDLPGNGDSQWSPDSAYLTSYQVMDLADLIDSLEVPRFVLVGHSFGGTVCARYTAMFPERVERLVLIEGFGPAPAVFARWNEEGLVERSRQWLAALRKALTRQPQLSRASMPGASSSARPIPISRTSRPPVWVATPCADRAKAGCRRAIRSCGTSRPRTTTPRPTTCGNRSPVRRWRYAARAGSCPIPSLMAVVT